MHRDLRPALRSVLERHGLPRAELTPARRSTHPTFLAGEVVLKVYLGALAEVAWAREAAALDALPSAIPAPRLIARGRLEASPDLHPYLILSRAAGVPFQEAALTPAERLGLARELGRHLATLRAQPSAALEPPDAWPCPSLRDAARRSSLPAHLAAQAEAFVAAAEESPAEPPSPLAPCFVHADLCGTHVFVHAGRISALIDWGDAVRADPHLELIQIYRDLFACERAPFAALLEAAEWPARADFPRRALAAAIRRQALGLAQHRSMDVFEPIAARWDLRAVPSLEALAELLFG